LGEMREVGESGVASLGRGDGLLDAHEAAVQEARSGKFLRQSEQSLSESGERIDLTGLEQIERSIAALCRYESGALQIAAQEQLVVGAGRCGDTHAVLVHVGRRPELRRPWHEIRRLDLEIGR